MVRDLIALALPGLVLWRRFSFNCRQRHMSRNAAMHDALTTAIAVALGEIAALLIVLMARI